MEKQPTKVDIAANEITAYMNNLNGNAQFHNNNAMFLNPRLSFLHEEASAAESLRAKVAELEVLLAAKNNEPTKCRGLANRKTK